MLIQGTNTPITLTFDIDVTSTMQSLVATLWTRSGELLKRWEMSDMTINGTTVTLPLNEDETKWFPDGVLKMEIKGLNQGGQTIFWEEEEVLVKLRKDRGIDLVTE